MPNAKPPGERGDQAAAVEHRREPIGHPGGCQRNQRRPRGRGPTALTADPQGERTERACHQPADDSEADLLEHQSHRLGLAATLGRGDGQRDQQQRDAEAIVQAALDVQTLSNPRRQTLIGNDGLAERGVGRRDGDGQKGGLDQAQPGKHEQGDADPGEDGQRKPDAEKPCRDRDLASQEPQVDPRRIGEEDERERRLGDQPQCGPAGFDR